MGLTEDLIITLLQSRLKIPKKDLAKVAAATAQYTEDGEPLTEAQVLAADLAIIPYVLERIRKGK